MTKEELEAEVTKLNVALQKVDQERIQAQLDARNARDQCSKLIDILAAVVRK